MKKKNGWTSERRLKQSQMIQNWQPWQHSTGAKTVEGKATSSKNAFKGGFEMKLRRLKVEHNRFLREQSDLLDKLK